MPGEITTFEASVSDKASKNLKFSWSVENAEIVDGDGTLKLRVKVLPGALADQFYLASLTITGLRLGCRATFSDSAPLIHDPDPILLAEVNDSEYRIDGQVLKTIGESLRDNNSSQLYVIFYSPSPDSRLSRIKASLLRQLSTTNIDPSRFTIVSAWDGDTKATKFYRVPPGASNPAP